MPARIASLGLGTEDIDCVYHFALYELIDAVKEIGAEDAMEILKVLTEDKRLKDSIPLIAMQVAAYKTGDNDLALVFTKILDRITAGEEEEDEFEMTDRKYWEGKSTQGQLKVVDEIFSQCTPLNGYCLYPTSIFLPLAWCWISGQRKEMTVSKEDPEVWR